MSSKSINTVDNVHPLSFVQSVKESKVTDLVLIIGIVALLAIGIIASCGVLNSMGAAHAVYLSYGMYAGAAALFILLVIKCALNHCSKPKSNDVKSDEKKENNNPHTNQTNTSQTDETNRGKRNIIETRIKQELLADCEEEKAIKKEVNEKIQKIKIESSRSSTDEFLCTVTLSTGESYSADLPKADINILCDALEEKHKIEYGNTNSGPLSPNDLQTTHTSYLTAQRVLVKLEQRAKRDKVYEWLERIQKMTINYVSGNTGDGCPFMCTVFLKTGESYTAELPREEINRLYITFRYTDQDADHHNKIEYGVHWNGERPLSHEDIITGLSSKLDFLEILSKLMDKKNA